MEVARAILVAVSMAVLVLLGECSLSAQTHVIYSSRMIHRYSDEMRALRVSREGHASNDWPEQKSLGYYHRLIKRDVERQTMNVGSQHQLLFPSAGSKTMSGGNDLGWLHYTYIAIGMPSVTFLVALDTGSDLLWLPCDCVQCAPLSDNDQNEYNPSHSNTSKSITCSHQLCERGPTCKNPKQPCPYIVKYASTDTSSSGSLVEDIFHLTSDAGNINGSNMYVRAPVIIGCGREQSGGYLDGIAPDGVLGLGLGDVSIPSLLAKSGVTKNAFSLCFGEGGSGNIYFGDEGPPTQKTTPFLPLDGKYAAYIIGVERFCIGSSCLDETNFNAQFDSGTTFTSLPDDVYKAVVKEFDRQANATRVDHEDLPFEYCYKSSSEELPDTPLVTIKVAVNNSFVVHDPLFVLNDTQGGVAGFCLAIQSSPYEMGLIGRFIRRSIYSGDTLAIFGLKLGSFPLLRLWTIDLFGDLYNLRREIPKEVEGLYNLREINLSKNQFTGQVPDETGACALLRSVDLSENSFSGVLPSTLQQLSLCHNLDFHSNLFTGEVTEWIGELGNLQTVDLSKNMFSGAVPNAIGNIRSLKVLNISDNGFSGSLPESMVNCQNIQSLDVSRNSLTGFLPTWVFQLGLQNVLFSENKLRGSIYDALTSSIDLSHQKLQVLDISHNALSGEIPSEIASFTSLRFLNISMNALTGEIPETFGKLKALDVLDLSANQLNGSIPREIGGATSLKDLILSRNDLSGNIPSSIATCSSLTSLILSRNNLSGQIPVAMAKLSDLEYVDLSFNKLTGTLPKPLANLEHLVSFNVSHNQLQGELPAGAFFNTISPSSVAGNPTLCGAAVNKSCPAVLPKPIVLNPNSTGTDPDSIPTTLPHKRILLSISALIAISAAAFIVIGIIFITVLNLRVRSSMSRSAAAIPLSGGDYSSSPTTDTNSGKLVMFSGDPDFSTGAHALLNKDCELGRGGFGAVYRTVLGDGRSVAIKKLTVSSLVKSQEDFEREVKKLGKIHHPNLVALEGYYWTPSLQLLIYEFVSGGNLYKHLHEGEDEGGNRSVLTWNERFNIILGIAKSMAHLHQLNVIHYNLKSSNVLIDGLGEPKVADFGLARLLPMLDRYVLSSKIQSALGYMAPEFACKTVKITEKCDVYGFGVLVLEIVTGRRPVEYMEDDVVILCDMVRGALEEGRVDECIDERLQGKFPAEEAIPVMKLGLICTSQVPSNRPDMAEVINILGLIKCPSESQEEESA